MLKQPVNETYLQSKQYNLVPRLDALKAMAKVKSNQFHVSLSERPQENERAERCQGIYTESKNQTLKLLKGQLPHELFIFNKFPLQNSVEDLLHHEL